MVGEGPLRVDVVLDDLADRIRLDVVDALEGGDDRLLRRGEGGGDRHQARVATAPCGRFVGGLAD